ncbi:Protein of uncharacterised function (DUF3277) [Cedecea lapagei]|uniref:Protein of uncharacterized function (DUF3277) n=1 Tax=Cedecea lapagei TaxID=158823 RepID=A0A3S4MC43_9ENTR|nr:phage protein [Cedecea lapagei]VEB95786.1 Protein of uncharacterised function (DUF3277) [Cedecea lapagei]
MGTYSFMDVTASLVGPTGVIDLGAGSANGDTGIKVEMATTKNTMTVGIDGEVMHNLSPAKNGSITVTLMKTSPVNKKLMQAYNAQTLSSSLWGKNTIVVRNTASGDLVSASSVAFSQLPANSNGKDAGTMDWKFDCGKIDQLLGEF